jgi:2-iminobutanoate/2-iminopropanoate deaminase
VTARVAEPASVLVRSPTVNTPAAARDPASVHAPLGPYSHQVELPPGGRHLVLSGQLGMTPDGQVPPSAAEQLELALTNVVRNLDAADMTASDLVKLTFLLVDEIDGPTRGAVIAKVLGDHRPAMTLMYVAALAAPPLKVEIDAWAYAGAHA